MIIIKNEPEDNGAYANQFSDREFDPPEGWSRVPEHLETAAACLPFAIVTFEDGEITDIQDNPIKPEPEPEPPDTITEMQNTIDLLLISVLEGL